jgi:putative nucleotidyltransferase with HDIG domain
MAIEKENTISVDQLQVGIYVHLDVGWIHHPFSFNNFKIRDESQLKEIRQLGLTHVRWDPARSDMKPLANTGEQTIATPEVTPSAVESAEDSAMMADKRQRIQRLTEHRDKLARVELAFVNAAQVVRGINKRIYSQPEQTVQETGQLIEQMVQSLLAAPELAIQAMAERPGNDDTYFHSLNVSVLSMTLARELKLPPEIVQMIGVGAIFHDIGLNEIPAKILHNPAPLSKAEREFRELHCQYGHDLGKKVGLPPAVLKIIHQHHEHYDGSGYPRKLKGEAIDPLARLLALVNAYDNLCNPTNIAQALTPHEALSFMFAQQRQRFDPRFLQAFIRFMGVYPPGTVVSLSNEALGLVIKVNSSRPLRPTVVVYDAGIPKNEAIILDLEDEPDINISRAIKPAQLPTIVFEYLNPRRRVSYYFDASNKGSELGVS